MPHNRPSVLEQLNPSVVRRFIHDQVLHHGIKPRTIQRRISSLKSFVQFCLKKGLARNDFMVSIQAPKADKKFPVYMSLEELRKLFHFLEIDSRPLSLRNHLLFKLLLATTEMRRHEIVD
jgi:site-specific recombinase XerD